MIDNLTDAIAHEKKEAENYTITSNALYEDFYQVSLNCQELANYHEQLAEWLTELQERREADRWIPVSERLPEEKINPYTADFDDVLCTTDWGDVQAVKFGTPILLNKPHFWLGGVIMDKHIIAWQYKPKPYESEDK